MQRRRRHWHAARTEKGKGGAWRARRDGRSACVGRRVWAVRARGRHGAERQKMWGGWLARSRAG
eukprot:284962-Prymnesium_polylepis.1